MSRQITFGKAINEAIQTSMELDPHMICYGLGADDPRGVFGTTLGLAEKFGPRVFDMPTSENGMTGVAIGAALGGVRSVVTHQRLDFFLLAMDQLVNNAAKWSYMFGGQRSVPITIRLILGRGWGQGPTHSQNLQSWFGHVPGLKVVMPTTAADAKGLLMSAIFDPNPVVFLEHRWLHEMSGEVPTGDFRLPLEEAQIMSPGDDVTIVSMSYMTVEALHALETLKSNGVKAELIDLKSVNPIDWNTIMASVKKTGRLLVCDTSNETMSVAGEIVARVSMNLFGELECAPRRLALPDVPSPTSHALTKTYYQRAEHIVESVGQMMGREIDALPMIAARTNPHDVPGQWFRGPF